MGNKSKLTKREIVLRVRDELYMDLRECKPSEHNSRTGTFVLDSGVFNLYPERIMEESPKLCMDVVYRGYDVKISVEIKEK